MPHIFISYAKKDTRTLAEVLFTTINGIEGYSAWMDESLESGESWALQIQEEIDRADLVIVLLSPDVNRKPSAKQRRSFVLNEIDYAQQELKPIVPILAQPTKTPVQIAGIQHVDFTQDANMGMRQLLARIQKLRPNRPLRAVTPSPVPVHASTPQLNPTSRAASPAPTLLIVGTIFFIIVAFAISIYAASANIGVRMQATNNPAQTDESLITNIARSTSTRIARGTPTSTNTSLPTATPQPLRASLEAVQAIPLRNEPNGGSDTITQIQPQQRFFVDGRNSTGIWIHISYFYGGELFEGWITSRITSLTNEEVDNLPIFND